MIISVTGATSNVGKTTLIERLLEVLPGKWGVCKVTMCNPARKHRCPHGKDDTCGICNEDLSSFIAETNTSVLKQQGKDTWRYYEAGAERVVWVRSRKESLSDGIEAALGDLSGLDGILFEGNHALQAVKPDLAVMVVGNPVRYKASAKPILDKIDISGEASDPKLLDEIFARLKTAEFRGV